MDDMKKTLVVSLGALMLLSSCGTYTGAGAVTGGSFGSIIGSAIGGISGGWRGSNVGSLIGMAGGAVVGAAIGSAADRAEQQRYEEYAEQRRQRRYEDYGRTRSSERRTPQYGQNNEQRYDDQGYYNNDQSGFDSSNQGDDRLFGFDENFNTKTDSVSVTALSLPAIEIRNAHIIEATNDGVLSRGEEITLCGRHHCKVGFLHKQGDDRCAEAEKQSAHHKRKNNIENENFANRLNNSSVTARAVILADKGLGRDSEAGHRDIRQVFDPVCRGYARHYTRTE